MKITREGNALVFNLDCEKENDWTQFLSDLRYVFFTKWHSMYKAEYSLVEFSESARMVHIREIENACKKNGVEVSELVKKLFREYAQKREETQRAKEQAEQEEEARKRALSRFQNGCGWCLQLKLNENNQYYCAENGKPCQTSAAEMELKFEEWKLTKRFSKLTPFPNKECKYLEVLR